MKKNETPINKAQTAAQELYTRTQEATREFLDTVTDSTERWSSDLSTSAKDAVEQVTETRERVRDELRAKAEPTADQVSGAVNDLIAWARRNSDRLMADLDEFRAGLESRLAPVTVVTKADLAELEARVAKTEKALAKAQTKQPAAKKPAARKPTAKKPAAKKATAKKATARKPAAKV